MCRSSKILENPARFFTRESACGFCTTGSKELLIAIDFCLRKIQFKLFAWVLCGVNQLWTIMKAINFWGEGWLGLSEEFHITRYFCPACFGSKPYNRYFLLTWNIRCFSWPKFSATKYNYSLLSNDMWNIYIFYPDNLKDCGKQNQSVLMLMRVTRKSFFISPQLEINVVHVVVFIKRLNSLCIVNFYPTIKT